MVELSGRDRFEQRKFGQELTFGDNPVLLIVDMMVGFTDPSYDLGAEMDKTIADIQKLREAAHASDMPVLHVYSAFEQSDIDNEVLWIRKQGGASDLIVGSDAVDFNERLTPADDEYTMRKRYASAFFATNLVGRLNVFGADSVVVAGCTTSGCVRATAIDAVQYGYVPVIPAGAVGDRDKHAHEQNLLDLEMKYAEVVETETARSYLEEPVEFER